MTNPLVCRDHDIDIYDRPSLRVYVFITAANAKTPFEGQSPQPSAVLFPKSTIKPILLSPLDLYIKLTL